MKEPAVTMETEKEAAGCDLLYDVEMEQRGAILADPGLAMFVEPDVEKHVPYTGTVQMALQWDFHPWPQNQL